MTIECDLGPVLGNWQTPLARKVVAYDRTAPERSLVARTASRLILGLILTGLFCFGLFMVVVLYGIYLLVGASGPHLIL